MAVDAPLKMQYHSGSGTNRLVFRGRIPAAVAGGFITDVGGTFSMATDVVLLPLMVTEQQLQHVMLVVKDHGGSTPKGGPNGTTAIFSTTAKKTGSNVNTLTAQAGTSSGTANILTGVVLG